MTGAINCQNILLDTCFVCEVGRVLSAAFFFRKVCASLQFQRDIDFMREPDRISLNRSSVIFTIKPRGQRVSNTLGQV